MNFSNFQIEFNRDLIWNILLVFFGITIIVSAFDTLAGAGPADVIGPRICGIVLTLNGGLAKGIATVAIFVVGTGLFMGKTNWAVAIPTIFGVVIVFSSGKIVGFLSGDAANSNCDTGTQ